MRPLTLLDLFGGLGALALIILIGALSLTGAAIPQEIRDAFLLAVGYLFRAGANHATTAANNRQPTPPPGG